MTIRSGLCLAAVVLALAAAVGRAGADPRPVVVELFTSQGCSSCPPADALLGELARRGDVVALGFHITYWDRLGWKDPLSLAAATDRQRDYARRFTDGEVYTPQVVVDGAAQMAGSDRRAVLAAIGAARPEAKVPVTFAADRRSVAVGAGTGAGEIVLVRFVRHRATDVAAGENAGRHADDFNGVRSLLALGAWDGAARHFAIEPPADGEGLAVLVQSADGPMLGAAVLPASDR